MMEDDAMADFDMIFSDKEREEKEKEKITPLILKDVTDEEYEQAMEEFYNDINFGFWRK